MQDTDTMDSGQMVLILIRLVLGAIASFLAIMLWTRTRDTAWIFVIVATIIAYVETVYSILGFLGISGGTFLPAGLVFVSSVLLSSLPTVFFIAAFLVMVVRKYRRR